MTTESLDDTKPLYWVLIQSIGTHSYAMPITAKTLAEQYNEFLDEDLSGSGVDDIEFLAVSIAVSMDRCNVLPVRTMDLNKVILHVASIAHYTVVTAEEFEEAMA